MLREKGRLYETGTLKSKLQLPVVEIESLYSAPVVFLVYLKTNNEKNVGSTGRTFV